MESAKRLIITEMLLENFKSYAGAQRVGPFHKVKPAVGMLRKMCTSSYIYVGLHEQTSSHKVRL